MSLNAAVAAHEAGHAICGVSVGRRIAEITLDPDDGNLGLCTYDTSVKHSPIQAMHDLYVAVSLVGGELGETVAAVAEIECPTNERGIARRRCVKIAPALGVEGEWLYRFVLTVARHCLKINAVQFDRVRCELERERQISGMRLTQLVTGIRRVNLTGSLTAHVKAHEPHQKTLVLSNLS
ncbi:MAG: hypothetical protein Q8K57_12770 [Thiobacillus sp.]|nr:hypothetical protein [Thiobacillus sp.]